MLLPFYYYVHFFNLSAVTFISFLPPPLSFIAAAAGPTAHACVAAGTICLPLVYGGKCKQLSLAIGVCGMGGALPAQAPVALGSGPVECVCSEKGGDTHASILWACEPCLWSILTSRVPHDVEMAHAACVIRTHSAVVLLWEQRTRDALLAERLAQRGQRGRGGKCQSH